jgi:lipid-binding SYLF domain-containing protein
MDLSAKPVIGRATRRGFVALSGGAVAGVLIGPEAALAASASDIDRHAHAALTRLYQVSNKARAMRSLAKAILVFPKITKAGFIVGGMEGDGVLMEPGHANTYYRIAAASYGLQAGAQTYSYALFFMRQSALNYLKSSNGWAVGTGPSVVVADKGFNASGDTTTLTQDVYAVGFGQSGLMAGLGIQGSKITPIHPGP